MSRAVFGAVDLGASGGRVAAGSVVDGEIALDIVHRFPNRPVLSDRHLRWDFEDLLDEVYAGLRKLAAQYPDVVSIGVDTWGVDYGLLDPHGELLADPISYRDDRTAAASDSVHARIDRGRLYEITGIQQLPFNTIYQLATEAEDGRWSDAATVVMLPDLVAYRLTGELATDATVASTTGLVDVRTGTWSDEIFERLGLDPARFPPIVAPGTVRGRVSPEVTASLGLPDTVVVTTVGGHDTASAVAAVPQRAGEHAAYISCGTWSLVGAEVDAPVLTSAARDAGFTNELGVDGRIRFLRNVAGMWLIQECLRTWAEAGERRPLAELLAAAADRAPDGPRFDADAPEFNAPGDMPSRIAEAVGAALDPVATVRCIVDSLADAYGRALRALSSVTGVAFTVVHLVGGGSRNELLARRTASVAGVPVVAGPVEATLLGNVIVQARTHGALVGSLDDVRSSLTRTLAVRTYEPEGVGVRG